MAGQTGGNPGITTKPIWVSEVGASSFGAEEVQKFGLNATAQLLIPRIDHVYWYSIFDLPSMAGHHAASRERGVVLLSPFLYGAVPRRRHSETSLP